MENEYLYTETPFAHFTRRTLLGVLLTSLVVSLIIFVLTLAVDKVVLQPALCNSLSNTSCSQSSVISFHVASFIAAIVSVVMLVQASVFRPLLVALFSVAALWNTYSSFLQTAPWALQLLFLVILNVLAYFTFTWLLRTYNFAFAVVSSVVLVVLSLLVTSL